MTFKYGPTIGQNNENMHVHAEAATLAASKEK